PGFVFSFALVAAACVVLYRLLDDVDVLKTAAALRAIPMRAIIAAFLLIAASYFTLTFAGRRAEIDPVRHLPMPSGADSGSPAMVGIIAFGEPRTSLRLLCLMRSRPGSWASSSPVRSKRDRHGSAKQITDKLSMNVTTSLPLEPDNEGSVHVRTLFISDVH